MDGERDRLTPEAIENITILEQTIGPLTRLDSRLSVIAFLCDGTENRSQSIDGGKRETVRRR